MSHDPTATRESLAGQSSPVIGELEKLLATAKNSLGRKGQLSWNAPTGNAVFRLFVSLNADGGQPQWNLKEIDGAETKSIWVRETGQLDLIARACVDPSIIDEQQAPATPASSEGVEQAPLSDEAALQAAYDDEAKDELGCVGEDGEGAKFLATLLADPPTGFYRYGAFLKFLEYEFYRFQKTGQPIALILFELGNSQPLSLQSLNALGLRVRLYSNRADVLGLFEANTFALLLPATTQATASLRAAKILSAINAAPLGVEANKSSLKPSFGIAGLPDVGYTLDQLIISAKLARATADSSLCPIVLAEHHDLGTSQS